MSPFWIEQDRKVEIEIDRDFIGKHKYISNIMANFLSKIYVI